MIFVAAFAKFLIFHFDWERFLMNDYLMFLFRCLIMWLFKLDSDPLTDFSGLVFRAFS